MKKAIFLALLCLIPTLISAESVRLYNDSPYRLRAVIRAADGTYLGEMVILPEHYTTWSTDYFSFGARGEQPIWSQTPYTVYWHCMDGNEYGICTNVAAGAAVSAQSCEGPRICKPIPKAPGRSPYGPKPGDEQLHQQNEAPQNEGQ